MGKSDQKPMWHAKYKGQTHMVCRPTTPPFERMRIAGQKETASSEVGRREWRVTDRQICATYPESALNFKNCSTGFVRPLPIISTTEPCKLSLLLPFIALFFAHLISATLLVPSQGSFRRTVVHVLVVLTVYSALSESPSLTVESRNEGDESLRVKRGFFCFEEGKASLLSPLRR